MRRFAGNLELVHRLREIVTAERMIHSTAQTAVYGRDLWAATAVDLRAGRFAERPDFVVWPETVEEISRLLRLAARWSAPVIPYGGGTSRRGGTRTVGGGIVCDMKRMKRLLFIDDDSMIVSAQSGMAVAELERHLRRRGLSLGPFPVHHPASTIGGALSVRAGGPGGPLHGAMADKVVSLQAVLPDGSIVKTRAAPRSATGPDLDHLLVGGEGTLGVITRAKLRVAYAPAVVRHLVFDFERFEDGVDALRRIARGEIRLAAARLCDADETRAAWPDLEGPWCRLLVRIEGFEGRTRLESEIVTQAAREAGGREAASEIAAAFFARPHREHYRPSKAFVERGAWMDWIDAAASWSRIVAVHAAVRRTAEGRASATAYVSRPDAHGASLTVIVTGPDGAAGDADGFGALWADVAAAIREAGGVFGVQWGVGLHRPGEPTADQAVIEKALRAYKDRVDPSGILNPGKLFGPGEA